MMNSVVEILSGFEDAIRACERIRAYPSQYHKDALERAEANVDAEREFCMDMLTVEGNDGEEE